VGSHRFTRGLVTGASSGIGAELARELARRGADLVLVARSADRLHGLAEELRAQHGRDVEVLPADLTDPAARSRVEERLRETARPVDLLVNNAGVGQVGDFASLDIEAAERLIELNVLAPVRLVHAALPNLRVHAGAVLNVSSIGGNQPVPRMATYTASKAFLTRWGEAVHEELRGSGVTVTTLAPGFTRTNFVAEADASTAARTIPGFVWADAADVARAGLDAAEAGRAMITPGVLYQLGAAVASITPSSVSRRVIGTVMRRVDAPRRTVDRR
jgi:uncharacterized protein